jgi:hypothetical protein
VACGAGGDGDDQGGIDDNILEVYSTVVYYMWHIQAFKEHKSFTPPNAISLRALTSLRYSDQPERFGA